MKQKLKKQKINVVFNYSSIEITKPMENLLNRGLNFCITPLKLDITQILSEFRRFERTMVWKEFFFENENGQEVKNNIFKSKKTNMPKDHKTPKGLKDCLTAIKSELMDPKNRYPVKQNIPKEEIEALKLLIKMQREHKIIIKPADKGAGITIVDFKDYVTACENHLSEKASCGTPYYEEVHASMLLYAKAKILKTVLKGYTNGNLTEEEFKAMSPKEAHPSKFYATMKVHKDHETGEIPPIRPIVSSSGALTENIALFVEHHIKEAGRSHEAYIQDTPDFLRQLQQVHLEEEDMLVVIDVKALYTNIPPAEAVKSVQDALNERTDQTVTTDFIIELLKIILKYNLFEFSESIYKQIIGVAMGTRPAPSIANIFMARNVDNKVWEIAKLLKGGTLKFMKRFLDDIFMVFKGSEQSLHAFIDELNNIHPYIKFTMSHTTTKSELSCDCNPQESIPFLDTLCSIKEGKISTNLYKKPTDKNQYLLTNSCHPKEQVENIPLSCATRINRICSEPSERDSQFQLLKEMLMDRSYNPSLIDAAIAKARAVPREVALRRVSRPTDSNRPVFVVSFYPQLPSIPKIVQKHWRSMVHRDQYLEQVFNEPPIVAYKRNRNIKDNLVKAKIQKLNIRPKRILRGMKKCGKCVVCPYIKEGRSIKSEKFTWSINKEVNCKTTNVVYLIECNKENCQKRYIGETEREFKIRISEHLGYARNKMENITTGNHFNLPGHSEKNMTFTIIEQVKQADTFYRKEREEYHINKFNTFYQGLNKKP